MYNPRKKWFAQARRTFIFIRPHRRAAVVVMILTLLGAALGALEPLIMKYLFDGLVIDPIKSLLMGVSGLLIIGIVREVVGGWSNWLSWKVRLALNYKLLDDTVSRLHALPISFHRKESVGGIMTKLDRGINGFVGAISEIAFTVIPGIVYLVISIIVMLKLDWRLSLIVLFFAPLPALIGMWAAEEQTRRERTLMDRWTSIFSRLNEVLSGILTVKCFAMEKVEKNKFLNDIRGANEVVLKGVGTDTKVGAAKNFVTMIARIAAIAAGGYLIYRGEITIGTLIAFLGYVGGLFGPVQGLTGVYQTMRRATVALDTIFSILDAHDPLCDSPDAKAIETLRGEVVFDKVSFGYQRDSIILDGIDLHINPGEVVALVGPSGTGKTTLMSLLQRLYDPTSGSIVIDGTDIREIKQHSLRQQIGVVLQDALLFNDTIRSNIAYGKPDATQREIEEAAKAANAHQFIMNLPDGYNSIAGERGGKLSAGERQRISIARALLKNPPVLILDEATSALDAESESLVQEALTRLVRGRTTFIIAHRLSTVVKADRILVMKDGTIVEDGTHGQLMGMGGYYSSLVGLQTRGFMIADAA